jgi:hypothetical protein
LLGVGPSHTLHTSTLTFHKINKKRKLMGVIGLINDCYIYSYTHLLLYIGYFDMADSFKK